MNNVKNNVIFHPIISSIQKVALYETRTKLFLVGSNNKESRFRILEIDRAPGHALKIYENPNEIESKDIRRFVGSLGQTKAIYAYGVLGFVRFLEGYYLILVTKRTRCAVIGMHMVYTIKDTTLVRVNEPSKQPHPHEQRYLKMFSNIDLNSNFYFSYSYDLTRSLQYNMSAPKFVGSDADIENEEPIPCWDKKKTGTSATGDRLEYAFRSISRKRFVWNAFLLIPMEHIMHKDWMLEIIHGFVSQSNISIFGRPVYVCLIARRSTRFAGTRFLKRGANFMGDVANEVETEQIVIDGHRMCSFVQMRGSIPSHWSQDISKMVPKPPISLDLSDPYSETSGKHFERLLYHFGAPIIILNLVKKREKRKHESILTEDMVGSIKYLNQFLPPQYRIIYYHFDMARKSRGGGNVMESLANIAEKVLQQTDLFFIDGTEKSFQTGIVRVNCVDCLDRTNTAQFAIGKCVLGHQLYKLGFIDPPKLEFDSDCVTMLESLYEDHGDTLALQYGGSQLVHRIKTYRKTAAWTSQGNDIMQTLSRYYSNTFSDTEKQHSINLFLGYYIPYKYNKKDNQALWEYTTDYYMHNLKISNVKLSDNNSKLPLTQWVRPIIFKYLPYSCSDMNKIVKELITIYTNDMEMIDSYSNYHLPYKMTSFDEHIAYQISHLARNFMRTFRTNFSPFEPGGRRQEGRNYSKNPSLTGQSSTSSTTSSTSSSMDEDTSSDDDKTNVTNNIKTFNPENKNYKLSTILPSMQEIYGIELKQPDKNNLLKYKQYLFNYNKNLNTKINIKAISKFSSDTVENVQPPVIMEKNLDIYENYINSPNMIFKEKTAEDKNFKILQNYIGV